MLTQEENDLVTRVENGAPLGAMLRKHFWIPAMVSVKLVADGPPVRSRLLGEDYVAFRATDGRVGFFDEHCPHRQVSLALARNEDNALRCIFHGWKYDVSGVCVDVPTQPVNREAYCKLVKLNHYPTREAAGIVWVYLGKEEELPPFPDFEFMGLPSPSHVLPTMHIGHWNWLQAVETTMDSAHLGILHSSSIKSLGDIGITKDYTAPVYETEHKPYGFRYASIRNRTEGDAYVRVNTFVAPWFAFISPTSNNAPGCTVQFSVPVDDEHSIFFFLEFRRNGIDMKDFPLFKSLEDPTDWPPGPPGGPDNNWGQDREAMKNGHFTGFPQNLLTEDLVCAMSMKPIVDRTKEMLNAADAAIVNVRKSVIQAVREFQDGKTPGCVTDREFAGIVPQSDLVPAGVSWREYFSRQETPA
jgi:phthalate 4,5-dioxygenase oxygenase subunit